MFVHPAQFTSTRQTNLVGVLGKAMNHHIFWFDYVGFRKEVEPFVQMADQGKYTEVIERARTIAIQKIPKGWVLEGLGTSLSSFLYFSSDDLLARATGFSFLVILSQFLRPISLPTPGFGNLGRVADSLGWNERDVKLLSMGMTTVLLLKPEQVKDPLERPPAADSHWYDPVFYSWWMRPENAFYTGWWDMESIKMLLHKLPQISHSLQSTDVVKLQLHPSVTQEILFNDYAAIIELFEKALAEQVGIYCVIS
jgi:hypothetical protein